VTKKVGSPIEFAVDLIEIVCRDSAKSDVALQPSINSKDTSLQRILRTGDTPALFDWMMESVTFQGISDSVAASYLERHGNATWRQINRQLVARASCPLLFTYWTYEGCRYDKTSASCAHPDHFSGCPVPGFPLRNGHLNQTAFSLFFFIRDIAQSDLVGWIDDQLSAAFEFGHLSDQEALIGPMRHIYGVSDKVLTMTLSSLLMADRTARPHWFEVGSQMIVVDRLVHNFLVRTGILAKFDAEHAYGSQCYGEGRCADILRLVSAEIDGRQFDPTYPADFPRYTQHALWRYCAAGAMNICNGNMIDDVKSCQNVYCIVYDRCSRIALKKQKMRSNM
jgi:hypothetical protein